MENLCPPVRERHLRDTGLLATIAGVEPEPLISHQDVTTIMRLLGDIKDDVRGIRDLLEDNGGEEEVPEADR